MNIFYCAKCNETEIGFKFSSDKEERVRKTWLNFRDGFGGNITHLICPHCGYVLSGFMNYFENVDDDIVNFIKEIIKLYSTRRYEGSLLEYGAIDYMYSDIIKKKSDEFKNVEDEEIQGIISFMSNIDDSDKELYRLKNKYRFLWSLVYRYRLNEMYIDSIIHTLQKSKNVHGLYFSTKEIENEIHSYLTSSNTKSTSYFKDICSNYGLDCYLSELNKEIGYVKDMYRN